MLWVGVCLRVRMDATSAAAALKSQHLIKILDDDITAQ